MKIKSLEIDGVGGIGHLEVSFGYGMNVIWYWNNYNIRYNFGCVWF